MSRIGYETEQRYFHFFLLRKHERRDGESQDDESDRDHAQEGQEPVGQSMKSLVTRGRQKEKKMWIKALWPHCAMGDNPEGNFHLSSSK